MATEKKVTEVWKHNIVHEFEAISKFAASPNTRYISLDTEFSGFLRQTPLNASQEHRYQDMKHNVDTMKMIQLGFTFYNANGESSNSWQINFKEFNPTVDPHMETSIKLLMESGIYFNKNQRDGVDAVFLSRLLWRNLILPCRYKTKWITFHGLYDFGYIVKLVTMLITGCPLVNTLGEFLGQIQGIFGNVYDLKNIAKLYGFSEKLGLMKITEKLKIEQTRHHHQAGCDSMLVGEVFWVMKKRLGLKENGFVGSLYGVEISKFAPMRQPHGYAALGFNSQRQHFGYFYAPWPYYYS